MTQKDQLFAFCEAQNSDFILADCYQALPHIPQASIRQLLQNARDAKIINFVDYQGTYRRI